MAKATPLYGDFINFRFADLYIEIICLDGCFHISRKDAEALVAKINRAKGDFKDFVFSDNHRASKQEKILSIFIKNNNKRYRRYDLLTTLSANEINELVENIQKMEVN